ncbi:MAG TPA: GNAT family N-acetyltransferase [Thermomicrobiales bacterium]|jgi:GNAT superfamily N-acetyltransferase
MAEEWQRGEYTISTDPGRIDLALVHHFLRQSYWAEGIPLAIVERSIHHSLPFGIYLGAAQVGFARIISDRATFAYLADVFVLEGFRGRGLGKWLMETILAHPELQDLRHWFLGTADAHGLYRQFGFEDLAEPGKFLSRGKSGLYQRMAAERVRDER